MEVILNQSKIALAIVITEQLWLIERLSIVFIGHLFAGTRWSHLA